MLLALLAALASSPDPNLVEFLRRARMSIPDARSITDVQLCPIDRKGNADVAFARPREARAYYVLSFRNGRATRLLDLDIRGDAEGLGSLSARAMEKRVASCRWVPPAELSEAWASLDGEGARP